MQLVERRALVGDVVLGVPHRQLNDDHIEAGSGKLDLQPGEQSELAVADEPHAQVGGRVGEQPGVVSAAPTPGRGRRRSSRRSTSRS